MIRRPPRSTQSRSSAASDVYKRQFTYSCIGGMIIVLAITLRVSDLWRRTSITLACLLVLAGAFARPWLGLHWPYDMVGGTLFGSAAVMITLAILPVRTSPSHGQPQA